MRYEYFISYVATIGGCQAFAYVQTTIDFEIKSIVDLKKVADSIAKDSNAKDLVVLNFQLFNKTELIK